MSQSCSYCKKPRRLLFKLVENKENLGSVERLACFPCLEGIAKKEMTQHHEELMKDAKDARSGPP